VTTGRTVRRIRDLPGTLEDDPDPYYQFFYENSTIQRNQAYPRQLCLNLPCSEAEFSVLKDCLQRLSKNQEINVIRQCLVIPMRGEELIHRCGKQLVGIRSPLLRYRNLKPELLLTSMSSPKSPLIMIFFLSMPYRRHLRTKFNRQKSLTIFNNLA
jgi:hypothetical protein